ncbi:MAG TPA: GntR family transcriptional regulator [Ktedonosporobacter sp.]|nr:GntR family transcriptional regulator [Ktedonosporobacter sp.]
MTIENVDSSNPLPLYFQVYKSLLERIQRGEFPPGSFLPPERQLTEDYGVSRITIIKALDELAREQYIKRQQGRGTRVTDPAERASTEEAQKQRRSIAFICHVLDHPYLFQILMGIARTAARQQYNLQVISSYDTGDEEVRHIKEAIARNVDGIIVYPHQGYHNESLYRELQQQHFPLVMVDRYYPQIDTDRVIFDDEIAGYELAKQLLQRGRRRIAVISYFEVEATSVNHRLSGYRRALQQRGLPYHDNLIWLDVYPSFHRSDELSQDTPARERLRKYVARYKPDALLTLNDDVLERVIYDLLILRDTSFSVSTTKQKSRSSLNWMGEIATFSHKPPAPYTPYHALSAIHSGEMLGTEAAQLVIARIESAGKPGLGGGLRREEGRSRNQTLGEERQVIKVPMNIVTSETPAFTQTTELLALPETN